MIVATHYRLNFLDSALESVLAQRGIGGYEVILVTPLDPCPVSARFRERFANIGAAYTELSLGPGSIGQYLAAAASAAQGDVLVILDDDDLWTPDKLRKVDLMFSKHRDASFLHNGIRLIDESGRALAPWSLHRLARHRSALSPDGRDLVVVPSTGRTLARLSGFEPGFNNSAIAIRRETLLEYRRQLLQINGGEDMFLYLCSIASGRPIMATSDRLTLVRIHRATSTVNVPTLVRRNLDRNRVCQQLEGGADSTLLPKMVSREAAFWELVNGVAVDLASAREAPRWIRVLLGTDPISPSSSELMAVSLGAAGCVSPRLAQAAWRAWRMAW